MRATGVPSSIIRENIRLLVETSKGVDPIKDKACIVAELQKHILGHADKFLFSPFCPTCAMAGDCEDPRGYCEKYKRDPEVFDLGFEQLSRCIKMLDRVYGFDALVFEQQVRQRVDSLTRAQ